MISMGTAATIFAVGVVFFLIFCLEDCIEHWQKGKVNLEKEKTRQQELKLERAKLERDKHHSV